MPAKQPVWYHVLVVKDICCAQSATDKAPILFNDFLKESIGAIEQDAALVIENRTIYN